MWCRFGTKEEVHDVTSAEIKAGLAELGTPGPIIQEITDAEPAKKRKMIEDRKETNTKRPKAGDDRCVHMYVNVSICNLAI